MITATANVSPVKRLQYGSIFLFCLVTVVALGVVPAFGYFYDYTLVDWTMFVGLYVATGLGITVGYHRLIAHRSFTCPAWVELGILMVAGWALQNSALKWCGDHLRHHAQCDGDGDPYNAQRGFWYSHCGWIFVDHSHVDNDKYLSRLRQDRVVMWQHRYYVPIVLSGFAFPFFVGLITNGWMGGLGCFLLAGVGRTFWVLNSTFCINSICHLWGSQPHGRANSSRNSWWVSLLTFGEGFHNYHHSFPSDYRNGSRWYNFDPSKWLIFTLSMFGLASGLHRSKAGSEPSP